MITDFNKLQNYRYHQLVVLMYIDNQAQGDEIVHAVRGWMRHYKENFLLVLAGDYHDIIEDYDNALFVSCPRIEHKGNMCIKHIEYVRTLRMVRNLFPNHANFVMTSDDEYPVNDFDARFLFMRKAQGESFCGDILSKNSWLRDMQRTRNLLYSEGHPTVNYCTHLPYVFEWDKWEYIVRTHNMDKESYVIENLYYNTYPESYTLLANGDGIRRHFTDNDYSYNDAVNAMKNNIFVSNSVDGYSSVLMETLEQHDKGLL